MSSRSINYDPVASLNITPLIDVLLVLIVMFILCLPAMTHEVPLDLPGQGGAAVAQPPHRLTIGRDGTLAWDGRGVSAAELDARLRTAAARDVPVTLAPDAQARFAIVHQTLASIRRAGVTRLGFEGGERFRTF